MGHRANAFKDFFLVALPILALAGGVAISPAATWTQINTGLPSAAVDAGAITVAQATPSTLYATTRTASGNGGLFKSTDGGANWKIISSVVGVNSVAVDPRNSLVVYALTGHGLLKSSNGGETWSAAGKGLPSPYVYLVVIDPVTPSTLFAVIGGLNGGIFKSTSGGASWNALNTGLTNSFFNSLVIDPATPSKLFALASGPAPPNPPGPLLLTSTDGGESWTTRATGLPANTTLRSLAVAPTNSSVIYATVSLGATNGPPGTGIFKSMDSGGSWTRVTADLPQGAVISNVIVDPRNASVIYLLILFPFAEAGGILKSTDGGESWTALRPNLPANTPIQSLLIDPGNSSMMYIVADRSIYKTADGGGRWDQATTGLTAIDVLSLATDRTDPATVYSGVGNNIFKSSDTGASWSKLFSFQLSPPSNPGFIPSPFSSDSPAYPLSLLVDTRNSSVLYASTVRGNGCYYADNLLFKSMDGGVSWTDTVSPGKSGCVLGGFFGQSAGLKAIDPGDSNTLYLAEGDDEDGGWSLLKSTDGGGSWASVGTFPSDQAAGVWAVAVDPTNSSILYAGLDDNPQYLDDGNIKPGPGGVFKSTDGGATWSGLGLSGSAVKLITIDSAHPNVLYAITEANYGIPKGFRGLFKSTDSGASWTAIDNGLAVLLDTGAKVTAFAIGVANSNLLYAATAGSGVFRSSDGGANWAPFNDGLTNFDVRSLAAAPGSRQILYAGTSNGVFKVADDTP
jgi:photosystem II stability/assembly factor-like uncharacterized protein